MPECARDLVDKLVSATIYVADEDLDTDYLRIYYGFWGSDSDKICSL